MSSDRRASASASDCARATGGEAHDASTGVALGVMDGPRGSSATEACCKTRSLAGTPSTTAPCPPGAIPPARSCASEAPRATEGLPAPEAPVVASPPLRAATRPDQCDPTRATARQPAPIHRRPTPHLRPRRRLERATPQESRTSAVTEQPPRVRRAMQRRCRRQTTVYEPLTNPRSFGPAGHDSSHQPGVVDFVVSHSGRSLRAPAAPG